VIGLSVGFSTYTFCLPLFVPQKMENELMESMFGADGDDDDDGRGNNSSPTVAATGVSNPTQDGNRNNNNNSNIGNIPEDMDRNNELFPNNSLLEVRSTISGNNNDHDTAQQLGLFAKVALPPGVLVLVRDCGYICMVVLCI
jgi:hypothetical protein